MYCESFYTKNSVPQRISKRFSRSALFTSYYSYCHITTVHLFLKWQICSIAIFIAEKELELFNLLQSSLAVFNQHFHGTF